MNWLQEFRLVFLTAFGFDTGLITLKQAVLQLMLTWGIMIAFNLARDHLYFLLLLCVGMFFLPTGAVNQHFKHSLDIASQLQRLASLPMSKPTSWLYLQINNMVVFPLALMCLCLPCNGLMNLE